MAADDIYGLLMDEEPSAQVKAQAMAEALRRTRAGSAAMRGMGVVASRGQNDLLDGLARSSMQSAQLLGREAEQEQGALEDAGKMRAGQRLQQLLAERAQKAHAGENALDRAARAKEGALDRANQRAIAKERPRGGSAPNYVTVYDSDGRAYQTPEVPVPGQTAIPVMLPGGKQLAKADPNAEKQAQQIKELRDRHINIKDNLKLLKDQIRDYGTFELFGPENKTMDQYTEAIATDSSKMADINSVSRPTEVEGFKKQLVKPSIFDATNANAIEAIENFERMSDQRMRNAFRSRGLPIPKDLDTEAPQATGGGFSDDDQRRLEELEAKQKQRIGQ